MRPLRAIPRAILIIVPTALFAGGFGFFLGQQSVLSQIPHGHSAATTPSASSSGDTGTPTQSSAGWIQTFACRKQQPLCATLPTNAYNIVDAETGSIVGIGTVERIAHDSVTVRFPSAPATAWQIEVSAPGSCTDCSGTAQWGPYSADHAPPTSLVVGG
jgi:hypothetical protein